MDNHDEETGRASRMLVPLTMALLLALVPMQRARGQAYSTSINGSATAFAEISDGKSVSSDAHQQNFNQTVHDTKLVSLPVVAEANGHVRDLAQSAGASFDATAETGALHVVATARSDTAHVDTEGSTSARVNAMTLSWSDTITFFTDNPAGSDFRLGLSLHDVITIDARFLSGGAQSFVAGSAQAFISTGPSGISGPLLMSISDSASQRGASPILTPPLLDNASKVLHETNGSVLQVTGWMRVSVASSDAVASVSVQAADTALFTLDTADPLASYSTASGVQFAEAVPEPASFELAGAGLLLVRRALRRRQDQHGSGKANS